MYVIAHHQITDPQKFFSDPAGVAKNAPLGVHGRQFCPSQDKTTAVCLWEADSIDAVSDYLDSVTGDSAQNTYFEVSTELAIGLPETASSTVS